MSSRLHFHFRLVARSLLPVDFMSPLKRMKIDDFIFHFSLAKCACFSKLDVIVQVKQQQRRRAKERERKIQNCNVQKGGARFPVSRKMWQRNVLFFFEQFERIFAYQFFLHVFTRRKTVCVKNVLLLNDGHLSRNTLASRVSNFSIICSSSSLTHEIFIQNKWEKFLYYSFYW